MTIAATSLLRARPLTVVTGDWVVALSIRLFCWEPFLAIHSHRNRVVVFASDLLDREQADQRFDIALWDSFAAPS